MEQNFELIVTMRNRPALSASFNVKTLSIDFDRKQVLLTLADKGMFQRAKCVGLPIDDECFISFDMKDDFMSDDIQIRLIPKM